MPEEIVHYLTEYGYLAIFVLVFLQETGMPNPLPNELLLIFSGYLIFKGILILPLVLLTVVTADLGGTCILYFVFYRMGKIILAKKPGWIPFSEKTLNRLSEKLSSGGQLNIFIFRLTPFTRGYTSVFTGLVRISPKVFLPIAFFSALIWASFYVTIGYFAGPSWNMFSRYLGDFKYFMIVILLIVLSVVVLRQIIKNRRRSGSKASDEMPPSICTTQT